MPNAKPDDVKAALAAAFMSTEMFDNTYTPIVVNTGGKLMLIDTGTGEAGLQRQQGHDRPVHEQSGPPASNAEAIDTVIISHYHGDHINGLLKADNKLAFPNAEILVPAAEHKFWMDDGEMSRAPKGRIEGLFKNNRRVFSGDVLKRVRTYEWDKEVVPGITAVDTPGHSPGHTSLIIRPARQGLRAGRRHARAVAVRAQSGLARDLRSGSGDGGSDAPQGLRHAGRREDDGAGLPLSVPVARLHREERRTAIARPWCRGIRLDLIAAASTEPEGRPTGGLSLRAIK